MEQRLSDLGSWKTGWLLLCGNLLKGDSQDWDELAYKRKDWASFSYSYSRVIRFEKDLEDNGIDNKEPYRKRLKNCVEFTQQENRILEACETLLSYYYNRRDLLEQQRSDLIGAIEKGRTLERDIEAVKARWSFCVGDVGLGAEKYAEEEDSDNGIPFDIEDKDGFMRRWMGIPGKLATDVDEICVD